LCQYQAIAYEFCEIVLFNRDLDKYFGLSSLIKPDELCCANGADEGF
jgi:hypothetical protein